MGKSHYNMHIFRYPTLRAFYGNTSFMYITYTSVIIVIKQHLYTYLLWYVFRVILGIYDCIHKL